MRLKGPLYMCELNRRWRWDKGYEIRSSREFFRKHGYQGLVAAVIYNGIEEEGKDFLLTPAAEIWGSFIGLKPLVLREELTGNWKHWRRRKCTETIHEDERLSRQNAQVHGGVGAVAD